MMYQVQYGISSYLKPGRDGYIDLVQEPFSFKTKREAERAAAKRAVTMHLSRDIYKVVKVNDIKEPDMTKVTTEELLDKLLTAVTAEYKNDSPGPGVVIAKIRTGETYASVCRYNQPGYNTGDKTVIASTKKSNVRSAIVDLSQTWLQKNVAKNALENALKGV